MCYVNDMSHEKKISYVNNKSYENDISFVNGMSYVNNMSYVNDMSYSNLNMEDVADADYMHGKRLSNRKIRWISWFVS